MDSNYATLNQYYRKQSIENYAAEYNSGSFELVRFSDSSLKIENSTISSTTHSLIPSQKAGPVGKEVTVWDQIIVKADLLPNNFELKSIDVFQKNADGVWASSIDPQTTLSISYDNTKKEIYIGGVGKNQLFPLILKERKKVVNNQPIVLPPKETMVKFHITW